MQLMKQALSTSMPGCFAVFLLLTRPSNIANPQCFAVFYNSSFATTPYINVETGLNQACYSFQILTIYADTWTTLTFADKDLPTSTLATTEILSTIPTNFFSPGSLTLRRQMVSSQTATNKYTI